MKALFPTRSAELHSAVPQSSTLPRVRPQEGGADCKSAVQQSETLRYEKHGSGGRHVASLSPRGSQTRRGLCGAPLRKGGLAAVILLLVAAAWPVSARAQSNPPTAAPPANRYL